MTTTVYVNDVLKGKLKPYHRWNTVPAPKVIGSGKGNARRTWWLDQHTGRNEKLHVNIPQVDNQHKDSHGIYLIFRETPFQKREIPPQDERTRTICCRGGRALDSMYPLSQFAIEKCAFRVAGRPREAIPFFSYKNLLTLLRKTFLCPPPGLQIAVCFRRAVPGRSAAP